MSSSQRQAITAVIYDKRGRVISVGQNSYVKTHPMMARLSSKAGEPYKQFLHAEVAAIIRCRDLSRAHRIFVSRFGRAGQPLLARPCAVCQTAIAAAGIQQIDHT